MRKTRHREAAAVVARQWRDPSRGELYWFLWDEHAAILQRTRAVGRRISWSTLLADVQRLGLTNAAGQPVTSVRTLQSTFDKVVEDAQREAAAKRPKTQPRPTNLPPPMVPVPMPVAPQPLALLGRGESTAKAGGPIDQLERLRLKTLRMSGKRV